MKSIQLSIGAALFITGIWMYLADMRYWPLIGGMGAAFLLSGFFPHPGR